MLANGRGAIVNVSSIMGATGGGYHPNLPYHATKGALVNMTRSLAAEWGRRGVRVNAIAPTYTETDLTLPLRENPASAGVPGGADADGTVRAAGGDGRRDPLPVLARVVGGDGNPAARRLRLAGDLRRAGRRGHDGMNERTRKAAIGLLAAVLPALAAGAAAAQHEPRVLVVAAAETTVDEMSRALGRAYVAGIQRELIRNGYAPGPADGVEGPRTRAAIRAWQRDAGLPQTGRASRELLDSLRLAASPAAGGPPIADVQHLLAARGYYHGAVDGIAGRRTRAAIRRFQRDAGLAVDGVLDRALLRALETALPGVHAQ